MSLRPEPFCASGSNPEIAHDFATLVKPRLTDMERIARATPRRPLTDLELYLVRRLENGNAHSHWLDQFEIHVAAELTEIVGAVTLFGTGVKTRTFSPTQWTACGAAGFVHVASASDFESFLKKTHATTLLKASGNALPQATLGQLYKWLYENADPAFDPVKDLVFDFAVRTFPLESGYRIFGRELKQRRLHSVYTASREYKIHPKQLRKILFAMGVVPSQTWVLSDNQITFDARQAEPLLQKIATAKTATDLWSYLGSGRVHTKILIDHGFIIPFIGKDLAGSGLGELLFAEEDLDDFLARLFQDTKSVRSIPENCFSIAEAAKRANCSAAEVVRLILDRKLKWVGRLPDTNGFSSVIVNLAEIKNAVHGPPREGLTLQETSRALRIADKVTCALVRQGVLIRRTIRNPINRCPLQIVPGSEIDTFRARYISLFALAKASRCHHLRLLRSLNEAGIHPAFDPEKIHARFYERASVVSYLPST